MGLKPFIVTAMQNHAEALKRHWDISADRVCKKKMETSLASIVEEYSYLNSSEIRFHYIK